MNFYYSEFNFEFDRSQKNKQYLFNAVTSGNSFGVVSFKISNHLS